jgi:hypothetical protein
MRSIIYLNRYTMDITLNFSVPNQTVGAATLVKQLPHLSQLLKHYCLQATPLINPALNTSTDHTVYVYAASVGIQRSYISLDALPSITKDNRIALQHRLLELSEAFKTDGLVFTPTDLTVTDTITELGRLNLSVTLPNPANFIGRDSACGLLRESESLLTKPIRQLTNALQMSLHHSPIADDRTINSIWCCNKIFNDTLTNAWLTGGMNEWWPKLIEWDTLLSHSVRQSIALKRVQTLHCIFSDYAITAPIKWREPWQFWQKPVTLATLLNQVHT